MYFLLLKTEPTVRFYPICVNVSSRRELYAAFLDTEDIPVTIELWISENT